MTARQQLARLLPLALLVVLAIVGLRGTVPAPRWNGPLRAEGVAIGIALEVVLGVLLVITLRRDRAERQAAAARPYSEADDEIGVPAALRFALKWLLGGGMVAIAAVLISNLHLHFFIKPHPLPVRPALIPPRRITAPRASQPAYHFPLGPILYGLLVFVIVAAVAISLWWAARQLRPALPAAGSPTRLTPRSCSRRSSPGGWRSPSSTTRGRRSSPATWRWRAASPTGARRAASRTPLTSCLRASSRPGSSAAPRRGG